MESINKLEQSLDKMIAQQKTVPAIKLIEKSVYGRPLWYPTCERGRAIAKLIREDASTIPPRVKQLLIDCGFDIVIEDK